jgi:hypothetical protein
MKTGDRYLNKFYDPRNIYSLKNYYISDRSIEYKGFTIDHRNSGLVHIIENGVCIHMRVTVREAKRVIDDIVKRRELGVYDANEFIV